MKYIFCIVGVLLFIVLRGTALSQEDTIVLNSSAFAAHSRPLVSFPHAAHTVAIDCSRCHHDFDEFGANTGGEGKKCAECHGAADASNPISLMKAFHLQCKSCHQRVADRGKSTPPTLCGQCHLRKIRPG